MASIYMDEHIPEEFTAELRELFSQFDHNNEGRIDIREMIGSLDKDISAEELEETVQSFKTNVDGKVGFEEFQTYLFKNMKDIERVEDVKEMFMSLDRTDSGDFTPTELRQAILTHGETISIEEATELINSIPTEEPGRVNYNEFCGLVKTIIGR